MPNNPVQIVLNDSDFLRAPDPGTSGPGKDFFEKNDAGFAAHRKSLLESLDAIEAAIRSNPYGPATYIRVQMRVEALAKSYRPNQWLLTEEQFPCVGADGIGTLYYRAPLHYIGALRSRIEQAEASVAIKTSRNTGEDYLAPTRARSEVGAIDSVEIAPPEHKRDFTTEAALQMLRDPHTVSGYLIELFETPSEQVIADDILGNRALMNSFVDLLIALEAGTRVFETPEIGRTPILEIQLTKSDTPPLIESRAGLSARASGREIEKAEIDFTPARHESVISKLAEHPLVRAIRPPVRLELADQTLSSSTTQQAKLPVPSPDAKYPIVGVIDSGVSDVLSDWVVEQFDFLDASEFDTSHGTPVAGLIAAGQSMNASSIIPDPSGCMVYDIPLFPKGDFLSTYRHGFTDFLEEIEQAVKEAVSEHGVRIFNLSINATSPVERYRYSRYAARLDDIADRYRVIFVNSAGNLSKSDVRSPWPKSPKAVVQYFANRTQNDTIHKPSESVRAISVGSLNPPGTTQVAGAPTVYTRRGPGLQVGVKPDVATFGGAGGEPAGLASGLLSVDSGGTLKDAIGTSFSAPIIARTLAGVDAATEGGLEIESLRAMLLHHSNMPYPLTRQGMKSLSRQFAGFGQPASATDMLQTDDHQITLLFQSRLTAGERKPAILRFPFQWPASMVDPATGACSGRARMTLVYAPPLDPAFGAEFVRVNLEASLRQRQPIPLKDGGISFRDQIDARYLPKSSGLAIPERALISHGMKWWPSKQYGSIFNNRGSSSEWRLEVSSLVRAEAHFPAEGIPFAVLLTLEDPDGIKPIFQEMRQALQASPARAVDVRTAARLRPRR